MLKIASLLQFALPGIPSIYYGDEAGMEGYHDPFCRFPYPWGREDVEMQSHYKTLCKIKGEEESLHSGSLNFVYKGDGLVVFERGELTVAVNAGGSYTEFALEEKCVDLISGRVFDKSITLSPIDGVILKKL
jgi:glycosidase